LAVAEKPQRRPVKLYDNRETMCQECALPSKRVHLYPLWNEARTKCTNRYNNRRHLPTLHL